MLTVIVNVLGGKEVIVGVRLGVFVGVVVDVGVGVKVDSGVISTSKITFVGVCVDIGDATAV